MHQAGMPGRKILSSILMDFSFVVVVALIRIFMRHLTGDLTFYIRSHITLLYFGKGIISWVLTRKKEAIDFF